MFNYAMSLSIADKYVCLNLYSSYFLRKCAREQYSLICRQNIFVEWNLRITLACSEILGSPCLLFSVLNMVGYFLLCTVLYCWHKVMSIWLSFLYKFSQCFLSAYINFYLWWISIIFLEPASVSATLFRFFQDSSVPFNRQFQVFFYFQKVLF